MEQELQDAINALFYEGQPQLRIWNGNGYDFRCWFCLAPTEISTNYPFTFTDHKKNCPMVVFEKYYESE